MKHFNFTVKVLDALEIPTKGRTTYHDNNTIGLSIRVANTGLKTFIVRKKLNNKIIKSLKKHSFLICKKNLISFYVKFNWKILPVTRFKIMDHRPFWFTNKSSINGMTYNFSNKVKKKILYYINSKK